jgi:hypothetical protein
MYTAIT